MDVQQLMNAMMAVSDRERSKYHLTLGELISELETKPEGYKVYFSHNHALGPNSAHSYRGYYSDLSFNPGPVVTAGQLLLECKTALGKTFEGWKGGDYLMVDPAPLWTAVEGETGLAIIATNETDSGICLVTKDVD
jgi:hypothetical protein